MPLLDAFLSDTIQPEEFDHRAHVIVGFEILKRHPLTEANAIYTRHLKALTERAGVPEKFSAPITARAMALIASRMSGDEGAAQFLERNPDLLDRSSFKPVEPQAIS
ncbi:hypothetical protein [uncultured Pelagimonas sp.]|uniref:hypothetical protein n=1 Tax=uncultured Pelagimonas sp. TaxID=1618102 RepID=UPI0026233068|nr:hypothetical protein [uncultured Pelagimonas sp.]